MASFIFSFFLRVNVKMTDRNLLKVFFESTKTVSVVSTLHGFTEQPTLAA